MNKEYLTPLMISNILHLGMNQTYKLFQTPGFPAIRIGKKWMIEKDDFEKYINELKGSAIELV